MTFILSVIGVGLGTLGRVEFPYVLDKAENLKALSNYDCRSHIGWLVVHVQDDEMCVQQRSSNPTIDDAGAPLFLKVRLS